MVSDSEIELSDRAREKSVLVLMGRPVIDVTCSVEEIPGPGQKILARAVSTCAGGVDGNYAESMARLGLSVTAVGSAGSGPLGHIDRDSLANAGVEPCLDEKYCGPETTCFVLVNPAGERSIIIGYPDDPERIALSLGESLRGLSNRSWDLGYLGVLREVHDQLLDLMRPRVRMLAATLEASDWQGDWFARQAGRFDVIFCADETYEAHSETLDAWQREHGWCLVVTEGARGSWMIDAQGELWREPAAKLSLAVVDTTGAGDAFASAFCAGHLLGLRGAPLLKLANWYAGQKVLRAGPRSYPPQAEFLAKAYEVQKFEENGCADA